MMVAKLLFKTSVAAVAVLASFAMAHADAIDGIWCSPAGKHLTIAGPQIITPGDVTMQGVYRRHEFAYIAPAGDADAGTQIYLRLISEDAMTYYRVKDDKLVDPETWERCALPPKTS